MEAKLALTESLLSSTDLQTSARSAIAWLAVNLGVQQAAVVIARPGAPAPTLVAGHCLSRAAIDAFTAANGRGHVLAGAFSSRASSAIPADAIHHHRPVAAGTADGELAEPDDDDPLAQVGFYAVPMRGSGEGGAVGLLLVDADTIDVLPDVVWVAGVLAKQVARLLCDGPLAELRLAQERMLLHRIINAVADPILLTDAEGTLVVANADAERLFTAPETASEGWRRAVAVNNMLFSAALSSAAGGGDAGTRSDLLLVEPLDGSDLLFEFVSSWGRDERTGASVVSILRNVTDLARARETIDQSYRTLRQSQTEVRDERHRLDLIIDSVADPIIVTDKDGAIVVMNEPAQRLFGAGAAHGPAQRHVRANVMNLSAFVSNVLTTNGERRYRSEMQLAEPSTGRARPVEGVAGTILSEQGELMWVVTILHDLTEAIEKSRLYEQLKEGAVALERKVAGATAELAHQNELLRRQHIALEQASALKSQFLANMSHEFRTPLNAILGYTHMLLNGVTGAITDPQRKSLTRIDSNSRHLLALINDILDITRIEAGRMPLTLTSFAVGDLIHEVMSELEPIIKRSQLRVAARVRASVPPVKSDRQKVKQIVLNLLSNALKFTPGGSVTISASYDGQRKAVAIAVRDTGVGIPAEDHAKVFEDFRQLDSSPARGYGGTGLGLSICRRLALMLGGSIDLASEPSKGSTFTLRLPARAKRR